jgi:glyoxylate reductase
MARPKILVTHPLFEEPRALLAFHFDGDYWEGPDRPPRTEVLRGLADKDALIPLLTEKVDDELLDAAPRLRIVANVAVGYDNVDLAACTRRKVAVTNTPGLLDETTADLAWALLMTVARRIVEADTMARSGQWHGWNFDQMCGADVWGKTLGIIGLGRIGSAMARRARGFGMRVIYFNRNRVAAGVESELHAEYLPFDQVLAQADFLSLHVPLTAETRGLIGPTQLARMKSTAFLINTTRGPVVQEAALAEALAAKTIAGAGLDVFEREPLIPDGLRLPNVVMTPHIGSGTIETRSKMATMAANNVVAFFEGRRPPNILNPEVLDDPRP